MSSIKTENITLASMLSITVLAGILLTLPSALADDSVVTDVAITVPVACAVTSTVDTAHTATIDNGTYEDDIGTTTIKTTCNDSQGFSIYAIGYTNEEYGNTTLKPSTLDATQNSIITGTATSGTTSNWAMKLTAVSSTYTPTILSDTDGIYSNYHKVPTTYTKVATMNSSTNATTGASIEATYAVYIAGDQPADTYNGKVKFTMVHPATEQPLQPQSSQSGKICYYPNGSNVDGTMGCQNVSSSVTLLASNFSRSGYGFAGWSNKFDYATSNAEDLKFYGPNETISIPDTSIYTGEGKGLSLYAVWIKSQGSLQDSSKVAQLCGTGTGSLTQAPTDGTANKSSVSALTDQRDHQTYAIAKLADGNCWMIENLRLESTATANTSGSLAQGYNSSFVGLATAESPWANNSTDANSLYSTDGANGTTNIGTSNAGYRFPRYNNTNTSSRATNATGTGNTYSYGNYYTWHAAIADTTANDTNNNSSDTTSICPKGWRLPHGGQTTVNTTAEFYLLGKALMKDGENNSIEPNRSASGGIRYYDSTPVNATGDTATKAFRRYPNNFVYSGYVYSGSVSNRGSSGSYWFSTAYSSYNAYGSYLGSSDVYPGTDDGNKYVGRSIRCLAVPSV